MNQASLDHKDHLDNVGHRERLEPVVKMVYLDSKVIVDNLASLGHKEREESLVQQDQLAHLDHRLDFVLLK